MRMLCALILLALRLYKKNLIVIIHKYTSLQDSAIPLESSQKKQPELFDHILLAANLALSTTEQIKRYDLQLFFPTSLGA